MNTTLVSDDSSGPAPRCRRPVFATRGLVVAGLLLCGALAVPIRVEAATFAVEEATIADIHRAIVARELATTELVKLYLARIKAYNGPGVEMPQGVLGPVKFVAHAKGIMPGDLTIRDLGSVRAEGESKFMPTINGRIAVWSFLGSQGIPALTVPAGFTTHVYDRIVDESVAPPPAPAGGVSGVWRVGSRLIGPVPARVPVGLDIMGRPFAEPVMLRIAAAYEAATNHRTPPPDFSPLTDRPLAAE